LPGFLAVTSTEMKHSPPLSLAARTMLPPVRERELAPATALRVPPQLSEKIGLGARTRPAGSASVKVTPVRSTSEFGGVELEFGFVSVKLSSVVSVAEILLGRKRLLMVGTLATVRVAEAVPPDA
jgi:hypothetical protein